MKVLRSEQNILNSLLNFRTPNEQLDLIEQNGSELVNYYQNGTLQLQITSKLVPLVYLHLMMNNQILITDFQIIKDVFGSQQCYFSKSIQIIAIACCNLMLQAEKVKIPIKFLPILKTAASQAMPFGIGPIQTFYLQKSIEHFAYKQAYQFLQSNSTAKVYIHWQNAEEQEKNYSYYLFRYFYYAGLICMGQNDYKEALRFLNTGVHIQSPQIINSFLETKKMQLIVSIKQKGDRKLFRQNLMRGEHDYNDSFKILLKPYYQLIECRSIDEYAAILIKFEDYFKKDKTNEILDQFRNLCLIPILKEKKGFYLKLKFEQYNILFIFNRNLIDLFKIHDDILLPILLEINQVKIIICYTILFRQKITFILMNKINQLSLNKKMKKIQMIRFYNLQ